MHLDPQDEERLSAYLDGELSSDEQARVEQLLAEEPAARQLLDELRAVSSTLQSLPRTRLPGDLAADVLREIERRGVQPAAAQGSRTLQTAVADAVNSGVAEPASHEGNKPAGPLKPSAEKPSAKPYIEEPVDWRHRLIRPLVYASIAVAVFAAVSLMTERAGDDQVHVARHLDEDRAADAERIDTERADKAERSDATNFDTDTTSSESLGKEDGLRRSGTPPNGRFAAPAAAPGPNGISANAPGAGAAGESAAGEGAAGVAGMTLSKPGPMSSQPVRSQMAVQADGQTPGQTVDPRAFYFQQAVANGEPVLVVQCRVTPEAVRQDLVGKLLAKNMVAVDDEAAAELDTAINTNVGYGQAVMPTPDNVVVEQSAMPSDEATPAEMPADATTQQQLVRPRDPEALEESASPAAPAQQSPVQQSIAQDDAAPGADLETDAVYGDRDSGDRDNKVAAKHRSESAFRSVDLFESAEAASGGSAAGEDEPTVYLIDASPEQLEGVLADLKSQTEGVVSVIVSPAPEAPTQNDYMNYNRGAPPEAVIVADEAFTEPLSPASAPDIAAAPAAAPPAPLPPNAPAANQIADQQPAVDESLQLGQHGRRMQRRVTNADEVRLQVQALGVLEEQLQNSPARREKLDRYGNASRARRLRPDTLSNFTPAPNATALYGQAPALYGQAPALANQAAAVNAPPEASDAPASGAAAPENTVTLGAEGAQAAAHQADGAESRRMATMRKAGQRAGQLLQRAVIVLEVQPTRPVPAKKG